MRDDHFIRSDIREVTPVKKEHRSRKSGSGLKILGALAVFMALVIAVSFGGAALVRGIESEVASYQESCSQKRKNSVKCRHFCGGIFIFKSIR